MRQINWGEVQTRDVVRVGGREFTVSAVTQGQLVLTNEDGNAAGYVYPSVLEFLGATLHRPDPTAAQLKAERDQLREELNLFFAKQEADVAAMVESQAAAILDAAKVDGWEERKLPRGIGAVVRVQDFEVMSEGVEVPE